MTRYKQKIKELAFQMTRYDKNQVRFQAKD